MIKFNKHNVTNGISKARVRYSVGPLTDGRDCVTLYAKDYGPTLTAMFDHAGNQTDSQQDVFRTDHVRFFPGDRQYDAALAAAKRNPYNQ